MKILNIEGVIGSKNDTTVTKGEKVFSFADLQNFLDSYGGGPFRAIFKSPGGSVEEGFKIFEELKKHEVHTEAIVANSIASVMFLAGKTRKVFRGSEMIIHNAWIDADTLAGEKLNFHTLKALTESFAQTDMQILDIYAGVAGHENAAKILALMAVETNVGANMALALGFATEIVEAEPATAYFKNRVLTYSQNQIGALNLQDGPVKIYADVIYINEAGSVLMLKRSAQDDFEPGAWGFPGGKVMQGETTEAGALREFEEETGAKLEGVERLGEEVNEDESLTVYFYASGDIAAPGETPEHELAAYKTVEELKALAVIKGQNERFINLVNQILNKLNMDHKDKVSAFEKALAGVKNFFKTSLKNMAVLAKDGTALFIGGEEGGELIGKPVFLAVEGLPTEEKAPAGSYELEDGKTITVDESGVISEASEPAAAPAPEEMEALKLAFDEEKKEIEARHASTVAGLSAQIANLKKDKGDATEKLNALVKDFADLKNQVLGDPDEKAKTPKSLTPKSLTPEEFKALSPGEKLRLQAMNKAEAKK
jgi:8-oxo-dGTP diphosphatase